MRSRLVSALALLVTAFLPSAGAAVQSQAVVQNRIAGAVNNGSRVALPGSIGAHARNSTDLGLAPANLPLESLSLRFSMTPAQQADLNQLLAAQLDPSSPSYHQWLTSEQFGARFGLSSSDLANVSSWLTSQGFTITSVAKSSTFISFSGTVAQAQQAFGTTIHNVSLNGEQHITNLTDPTLPSAIASVTLAVTGLNDFKLKPRSRARNVTNDSVQPGFTTTVGGVTSHYIAPGDLYTIYDYPPSSSNLTGAGITIAVMGATDLTQGNVLPDANLTAFRTAAGLPAINLKLQLAGTDPGLSTADIDEAHLDVEWSGASAPGATIEYVYGQDVLANSLTYAIDASPTIAPIITISYGGCESGFGASYLATYNQLLQMANAKGITVMSSSGDNGATDCDTSGFATEGLNVDFPTSSPFVTSAGGTMFSGDVSNASAYWNSSNASNNSSAKTYIPEQPWNETTATGGLDAGGSGGGGASGFFSKPAWQTGLGVPNDSSRDVPDVSLNAAAQHDGFVVCSQGSCTNGFLAANGQANVFGGTSFVAPSLAGILALVEQHLGTGALGNIGPTLYGLANGPTASSIFHDIITGNNAVPCSQGTPNCPNGGSIGYNAGTGYDLATGLGSLDVNMLVTNWASATPTGTGSTIGAGLTTTTVTTTSQLCAVNATTLPLTVTVGGSITGTTPTGTVQFLVDNKPVGTPQPLVSGTLTFGLPTATITSGGHTISAAYSGDGNYAGSKGTLLAADSTFASVDFVSATQKDFSLTPCSGSVTVASGATSTGVVFTITPVNGFTGAVTMSAVNNNLGAFTPSFSVTPVNITSASGVTTSFIVKASQTTTAQLIQPRLTPFQRHPSGKVPWYAAGSGATLACMLLLTLPRRRRWAGLLAVVLSLAALTAVGCGGNTSTTGGTPSTGTGTTTNAKSGTYTFTITAVSGTLVHSAQVTVTVP
jgi:Pro-kumamolisin, activation domain/Bacterial Ig-like domain (group 3)